MSDAPKQAKTMRQELDGKFKTMSPDDSTLLKDGVVIEARSMLAMSKEQDIIRPVVMLTIRAEGHQCSTPIDPAGAKSLGVDLIEAAAASIGDQFLVAVQQQRGVSIGESLDILHDIVVLRETEMEG